ADEIGRGGLLSTNRADSHGKRKKTTQQASPHPTAPIRFLITLN
ncbi:MAG: hypothetical protein ACI8W8_004716, partial [Rhodothermales bacterium]